MGIKQCIRYTLLLLEFAVRAIGYVWTEPTTVTYDRIGKTLLMRFNNYLLPDEPIPDLTLEDVEKRKQA